MMRNICAAIALALGSLWTAPALAGDANLPAGAVARMGNDRFRVPAGSAGAKPAPGTAFYKSGETLGWSQDGKSVLWAEAGGQVVVFHAREGYVRRTFDTTGVRGNAACFSQDGKFLCTTTHGEGGKVNFWNTENGKAAGDYSSGKTFLGFIVPAGGSRFLLLHSNRPPFHLYDAEERKALAVIQFKADGMALQSIDVSPDGTAVAVAGQMTAAPAGGGMNRARFVLVLDLPSGKQRFRQEMAADNFSGTVLGFTADGKHLLLATQQDVLALDAADGKEIRKFASPLQTPRWMACSPDGKNFALGGYSSGMYQATRLEVFDFASGKVCASLPTANSYARGAFSPDSKTIALSTGLGGVMLVEAATGRLADFNGHCGGVTSIDISPDGKTLASVGTDCRTVLWDIAKAAPLHRWFADAPTGRVAFSRDGRMLAVSCGSTTVRFFDTRSGENLGQIEAGGTVLDILRWPGRDTFVFRKNFSFGEINPATGKQGRETLLVTQTFKVAPRPDGAAFCAWGFNQQVLVIDANAGTPISAFNLPAAASQLELSADGLILVAAGQQTRRVLGRSAPVPSTPPESAVLLLETVTGKTIESLGLGGNTATAFSPDGRLIAIGRSSGQVRVWSLLEARDLAEFRGHSSTVSALKWTPDGKALATASADGVIYLWDTAKMVAPGATPAQKHDEAKLKSLWEQLANEDANSAFVAVRELARGGEGARAMLMQRLSDAVKPQKDDLAKRVDELVTNLDSPKFAVRKAADDELAKMGDAALPALRAALKRADLPAETRARLEALAPRNVKAPVVTKDALQLVRALLALRINDPAAGADAAAKLAAGDPAAEITPLAAAANACIKTTAADRDAWKTAPTSAPAAVPTSAPAVVPTTAPAAAPAETK